MRGLILPGLVAASVCCGANEARAALNQWTLRYSSPQTNLPGTSAYDGNYLQGAAYGDGTFVATGTQGKILTSFDGASWTNRTSGTANGLWSAMCANGTFVAAGYDDEIATSTDGVAWADRFSSLNNATNYIGAHYYGIAYGNAIFVAVGMGGFVQAHSLITASPDGTNWTTVAYGSVAPYLLGVTYGGGAFITVGGGATIFESEGAIAPAQPKLGPVVLISGGTAQGAITGVPGQGCNILASTNLADWLPLETVTLVREDGTGQFSDPAASNFRQRFYRAIAP